MQVCLALALLLLSSAQAQTLAVAEVAGFSIPEHQALLNLDIRLQLSSEMQHALEQGVMLPLRLDVRALDGTGWSARELGRSVQRIELRYLPLTRRYQIAAPDLGYKRGFARFANLMANLEQWRDWPLAFADWPLDGVQVYQLRVTLDRGALPAPLRLPALLKAHWALDSGRITWRVDGY